MVVEEGLVGLLQDRVVLERDLELVEVGEEFMDQVEQEELDQVDLEALELVQVELVLVDLDREALVQVFPFA